MLFIFSSCENIGTKTFKCTYDYLQIIITTSGKTFSATDSIDAPITNGDFTGDFEVTDEYYFFRTSYEGEKVILKLDRYTKKLIRKLENDEPEDFGTCELLKKSY